MSLVATREALTLQTNDHSVELNRIITRNTAHIMNVMNIMTNSQSSPALNADEEVIRKRGRRKTPKVSPISLRRSPRKCNASRSETVLEALELVSQSDQTHVYFLRTPKKSQCDRLSVGLLSPTARTRTPTKQQTTVRTSTPITPLRVSPRKQLLMSGNDSGIDMTPNSSSGPQMTPTPRSGASNSAKSVKESPQTKRLAMTKRRRRRYF